MKWTRDSEDSRQSPSITSFFSLFLPSLGKEDQLERICISAQGRQVCESWIEKEDKFGKKLLEATEKYVSQRKTDYHKIKFYEDKDFHGAVQPTILAENIEDTSIADVSGNMNSEQVWTFEDIRDPFAEFAIVVELIRRCGSSITRRQALYLAIGGALAEDKLEFLNLYNDFHRSEGSVISCFRDVYEMCNRHSEVPEDCGCCKEKGDKECMENVVDQILTVLDDDHPSDRSYKRSQVKRWLFSVDDRSYRQLLPICQFCGIMDDMRSAMFASPDFAAEPFSELKKSPWEIESEEMLTSVHKSFSRHGRFSLFEGEYHLGQMLDPHPNKVHLLGNQRLWTVSMSMNVGSRDRCNRHYHFGYWSNSMVSLVLERMTFKKESKKQPSKKKGTQDKAKKNVSGSKKTSKKKAEKKQKNKTTEEKAEEDEEKKDLELNQEFQEFLKSERPLALDLLFEDVEKKEVPHGQLLTNSLSDEILQAFNDRFPSVVKGMTNYMINFDYI